MKKNNQFILQDFFADIWANKIYLIIPLSIFFIAFNSYNLQKGNFYNSELIIHKPISNIKYEMKLINNFMKQDAYKKYAFALDEEILKQDFINEFINYKAIRKSIKKYSYQYKNFDGTAYEKKELEIGIAKTFKVKRSTNVKRTTDKFKGISDFDKGVLTIYTVNLKHPEEFTEVLGQSLKAIFTNINQDKLIQLKNIKNLFTFEAINKEQEILSKIKLQKKIIDRNIDATLSRLKEDMIIARKIEAGAGVAIPIDNLFRDFKIDDSDQGMNLHLIGYKGLETKISYIENLDSNTKYNRNKTYRRLLASFEEHKVLYESELKKFNKFYDNLLFHKNEIVMNYDLELINTYNTRQTRDLIKKNALGLIISLLFGFLLLIFNNRISVFVKS